MVTVPILVFLDWRKEFHVHVDASCIVLGAILTWDGEGEMDHRIAFASRKLSKAEKNYLMTERKALDMVYTLQKFKHYLLGGNFKMYTDHSALKYLVNKPMIGGNICRWLLLFQEYEFELILIPRRLNVLVLVLLACHLDQKNAFTMLFSGFHHQIFLLLCLHNKFGHCMVSPKMESLFQISLMLVAYHIL